MKNKESSKLKLFCDEVIEALHNQDEWCYDCGIICTLDEGKWHNRWEYLDFLCNRCEKIYFGN